MRFNSFNIIRMWNRKGYTALGMMKDLQSIVKYIDNDTLNSLSVYIYMEYNMTGGIHQIYRDTDSIICYWH